MSSQRAVQLLEAGLWLRLSGDQEGARRLFEQALRLDPDNARAKQLLEGVSPGAVVARAPVSVPSIAPPVESIVPGVAPLAVPAVAAPEAMEGDWGSGMGGEAPDNEVVVGLTDLPPEFETEVTETDPPGDEEVEVVAEVNQGLQEMGTDIVFDEAPVPVEEFVVDSSEDASAEPESQEVEAWSIDEEVPSAVLSVAPPVPDSVEEVSFEGLIEAIPTDVYGKPAQAHLDQKSAQLTAAPAPNADEEIDLELQAAEPSLGEDEPEEALDVDMEGDAPPIPEAFDELEFEPEPPVDASPRDLPPSEVAMKIEPSLDADLQVATAWADALASFDGPPPVPQLSPEATSAWDAQESPAVELSSPSPSAPGASTFDLVQPKSPAPSSPGSPAAASADAASLVRAANDRMALDDHTGALELIGKAQALAPTDSEVLALKARIEKKFLNILESKLGSLDAFPKVKLKDDDIIWLNLDHRAGFVLAQIDGGVTFEDLFAVSGMSRFDTARILVQLVEQGVIARG